MVRYCFTPDLNFTLSSQDTWESVNLRVYFSINTYESLKKNIDTKFEHLNIAMFCNNEGS